MTWVGPVSEEHEMVRTLINIYSSWLIVIVGMLLAAILVVTVLTLKRRFAPILTKPEHNDMVVVLTRVLSALYSILLGLTVVTLVSGFTQASREIAVEANAYSAVTEVAEMLPEKSREQIHVAWDDYIHTLLTTDWSAIHDGDNAPAIMDQKIANVFKAIASFEPVTKSQQAFYNEMVKQFNIGLAARAARWGSSQSNAPNIVRIIMFINILTLLISTCMLGSVRPKMQMALTIMVNAVVFGSFVLTLVVDYPFSGDVAVTPETFKYIYRAW